MAACAAILAVSAFAAEAASARTDNRTKPIVFVHGLDAFGDAGADCAGAFNNMANTLGAWGHTGAKLKVKYYWADSGCTESLGGYGSHSAHFPRTDAHQNGDHDMDADIRHLGYHLAWMIYNKYSSKGVTVDAVGHSMGGLILRYMLDRIEANDAAFPPYLYVEDAVTLGTPHQGSGWADGCFWAYECNQMVPGSSFMSWMNTNAQNPQGDGGTDWTLMSSYNDEVVDETSGDGMTANHKVSYYCCLAHSDYMQDTSDARDADVEYNDFGGQWFAWYDAPHAVRWADHALYLGSW